MIGLFRHLLRRRPPGPAGPSTYHKALAVHIAVTTRSAGRKLWP